MADFLLAILNSRRNFWKTWIVIAVCVQSMCCSTHAPQKSTFHFSYHIFDSLCLWHNQLKIKRTRFRDLGSTFKWFPFYFIDEPPSADVLASSEAARGCLALLSFLFISRSSEGRKPVVRSVRGTMMLSTKTLYQHYIKYHGWVCDSDSTCVSYFPAQCVIRSTWILSASTTSKSEIALLF